MKSFAEWMSLKFEAVRKKAEPHPLKPISSGRWSYAVTPPTQKTIVRTRKRKKPKKVKPTPTVSVDIDKWMQSLALLAKDIEEYKKIRKKHDDKMAEIAKKQKEQERLAAAVKKPEVKKPQAKPEVKKPEVKKPEVKKPEVKKPEVKKPEVKTPIKPQGNKPKVKKPVKKKVQKPKGKSK